jgi:hypothetical protein
VEVELEQSHLLDQVALAEDWQPQPALAGAADLVEEGMVDQLMGLRVELLAIAVVVVLVAGIEQAPAAGLAVSDCLALLMRRMRRTEPAAVFEAVVQPLSCFVVQGWRVFA